MAQKRELQTSKGELKALMEIIAIYYEGRKKLEQTDNKWIMVTYFIFSIFKKLINRLAKVSDEANGKSMKVSLKHAEAVALLLMLQYIDSLSLPFGYYSTHVILSFIGTLDRALS